MSALTELQGNSDAAASSPEATQPPPASTDASTSAAAAAMLDKLALLDEARKQERERRREETRASADPRESVACFLKGFASRQRSVEDALQRMLLEHQQLQGAPNGTNSATQAQSAASSSPSDQHDFDQQQQQQLQVSAANPESVAASLELLTSEALQMEQSAAAASYYLPLYDQKQCANTVAALRAAIEAARGTLAPRKRFTFGSKKVNKVRGEEVSASAAVSAPPSSATASSAPHPAASTCSAAAPNAIPSTSTSVTPASSQTHGSSQQADRTGAAPGLVVSEQDRALVARGRGLLGLYDTVVVRRAEEVAGGDFVLLGLTRCTVVLLGQLPALRMVGLRGCRVVAGPVTGACFVDDVQDSTLTLATYQVRVHRTHASNLFLRVRSKPIIEHSTGVRVAPWAAHVAPEPRLDALLQAHKLGEETGCWQQVDDFGWIKAVQSPNWGVMGQEDLPRQLFAVPEEVWGTAAAAGAAAAAAAREAGAGAGTAAGATGPGASGEAVTDVDEI